MPLRYGLNDSGEPVDIDQVPGGRTMLTCPYCGTLLIARKGENVVPHFAHAGKTCRTARIGGKTMHGYGVDKIEQPRLKMPARKDEAENAPTVEDETAE